jgi:hypothetical protein
MQLLHAAERLKLTYRKADHWASKGYITAHYEDRHGNRVPEEDAGSGYVRVITAKEFEVLRMMAHLTNAGVKPDAAARYARRILRGSEVKIGPLVLKGDT